MYPYKVIHKIEQVCLGIGAPCHAGPAPRRRPANGPHSPIVDGLGRTTAPAAFSFVLLCSFGASSSIARRCWSPRIHNISEEHNFDGDYAALLAVDGAGCSDDATEEGHHRE